MERGKPFGSGMYVCSGHYHSLTTHQMVNPFTWEVMPDQWCQGNRPPNYKEPVIPTPERRVKRMAEALWCKIGKHAFDPDDENAEEFTRTVQKRDKHGDRYTETKTFSVCGDHLSGSFQPKAINGESETPE